MKLHLSALAALALAACNSGENLPDEASHDEQVRTFTAAPNELLLPPGEYRIAGADGREIDLPHAITVSITADAIVVASGCVTLRWAYVHVDGRMVTSPVDGPNCKRARYLEEEAIGAVFDAPTAIDRTPANAIELTGGGHSIAIFSQ